jgi:hypothetical protein
MLKCAVGVWIMYFCARGLALLHSLGLAWGFPGDDESVIRRF